MKVSEIFYSLQGEGFLAGTASVFVRLAGCPLRCRWCDTKYAWDNEAGDDYSIEKILQAIQQWPSCKFIVITGGEPMINPDLPGLVQKLKLPGRHITIETAGIAFVPGLACDLMSISPKMSNSAPAGPRPSLRGQRPKQSNTEKKIAAPAHSGLAMTDAFFNSRLDAAILRKLLDNYKYQLKFVVDSQDDLPEIQQIIEKIGGVDTGKIMLMPQAATRDEFLAKSPMVAEMCRQSGFAFSPRLQVLLWNNKRGT
ncbi:MAG: 7-carboxy-7-deazaguanine synthase QueE [Phycisphaerae bacterium]|jgi:7-carboxy-7-deazaguanine synthase